MRTAAKVDRNQRDIVAVYRDAGVLVLSLANLGRGVPDLLVGVPPVLCLVEVKMPGGTLTPDQVRFHSHWPVVIVTSIEEARVHAQTLAASLSDLRTALPFVSGYASVLLDVVRGESADARVLSPDWRQGGADVGQPPPAARPRAPRRRRGGPVTH